MGMDDIGLEFTHQFFQSEENAQIRSKLLVQGGSLHSLVPIREVLHSLLILGIKRTDLDLVPEIGEFSGDVHHESLGATIDEQGNDLQYLHWGGSAYSTWYSGQFRAGSNPYSSTKRRTS